MSYKAQNKAMKQKLRSQYMFRRKPMVSQATKKYVKRAVQHLVEEQQDVNVTTATNVAYDATASTLIYKLSSPAVTDAKLKIINLHGRYQLTNPASAGMVTVRCILFQWFKDSNDILPVPVDILVDSNTSDSVFSALIPKGQINNNYKIISDRLYTLGEAGSVEGTDKKNFSFNLYGRRLPRKYLHVNASATGINDLFMLLISDVANASSPPTILGQAEFNYKRMDQQ